MRLLGFQITPEPVDCSNLVRCARESDGGRFDDLSRFVGLFEYRDSRVSDSNRHRGHFRAAAVEWIRLPDPPVFHPSHVLKWIRYFCTDRFRAIKPFGRQLPSVDRCRFWLTAKSPDSFGNLVRHAVDHLTLQ